MLLIVVGNSKGEIELIIFVVHGVVKVKFDCECISCYFEKEVMWIYR